MYAGAPLALGVFRRRLPRRRPAVPAARGGVLSPLAFVVSGLIILWSGWDTDWKLGVAILLGYLHPRREPRVQPEPAPRLQWRAAQWLPVYLVGMGLISWQGRYCWKGPARTTSCGATAAVPQWWDLLLVAAFSLGIYSWALAVRLPDEEAQGYIGDVDAQIGSSLETTHA